ncbi:unnamed protein product [Hydatigera taeniaeformis]|uniref:FGGY_N domain-containing protein n=1 Tax=Hydatigena taeniaeformis TaxID=6205 RepID=A0A0R3WLI5_HYDTA|nr:unnamed protein product [Hydatigera taeniaeformis]
MASEKRSSRNLIAAVDFGSTHACTRIYNAKLESALNRSGRMLYKVVPNAKFKMISHYKLTCIFAVTRLAHMFDEDPVLYEKCRDGEFVYGCLETWLLWRLTGGRAWCTDVSCTSATGAFDPSILGLSPMILNFLKISPKSFPAICPTSTFFGEIRCGPLGDPGGAVKGRRVRVTALIGDSQAAMLGEGCLRVGDAKLTLGTGAFLNVNIGSHVIPPNTGKYSFQIARHLMTLNFFEVGFYPVVGWAQSARTDTSLSCEALPDTELKNVTFLIEGFNSDAGSSLNKLKEAGTSHNVELLLLLLSDVCGIRTDTQLCFEYVLEIACIVFREYSAHYNDSGTTFTPPMSAGIQRLSLLVLFIIDIILASHWLNNSFDMAVETSPVFVPSSLGLRKVSLKKRARLREGEKTLTFVNTNTTLTEGGIFVGLPEPLSQRNLPISTRHSALFALMDSIVMSARLLFVKGVNKELVSDISVLRLNGNLTQSDWLMQRLADTLNLPVERSAISETCCLGAAIAAGVGAGIWDTYAEAVQCVRKQNARLALPEASKAPHTRFIPNPASVAHMQSRYFQWTTVCAHALAAHDSELVDSEPIISLNSLLKLSK